MKVIGPSNGNRVRKIVVAAEYAKIDLTVEDFFPRGVADDVLKEFKKKNPNGKIPVLETPEGCIYESNAILRYIARISKGAQIYGANKHEQALVDQYLDWTTTLLEPAFYAIVGPQFGYFGYNAEAVTAGREKFITLLKIVEERLANNKYLVGNSITIADINLGSYLWPVYRFFTDDSFRSQLPNVTKYSEALANEEPFLKVWGKYFVSKTPLTCYQGPLPHLEVAKKAEPKPKAAQPKKEAAPKKEKKPKDDEEDEDLAAAEKKEKNPLDSLPPTSFNLFDFKTLFVNAPNKKEALQFFWDNVDLEGFSVWRMEYEKAEGEGNVLFLTSNLMNGFLQRLETFRKYAFGVVGVYGQEPNLEVRGCWVWRGTEIPFEIKDHPSGEWYKFKKLDIKNSAADKQIQEDYWTKFNEDEDVVEGLLARDVKYFK